MMTDPGVGPIAALSFNATLGDSARFNQFRTVASPFGLSRGRCQSGEYDKIGRIPNARNRDVSVTLHAAASALLMRTMAGSQINSWGIGLMRNMGRRRAVVAFVRKLDGIGRTG